MPGDVKEAELAHIAEEGQALTPERLVQPLPVAESYSMPGAVQTAIHPPLRPMRIFVPPAVATAPRSLPPRATLASASDHISGATGTRTATALPQRRVLPLPHFRLPPGASRWSASAWAFLRAGDGRELGTGSMLGGSQVGGRVGYRINEDAARPVSILARIYAPVNRPSGSEAALGLEWKPIARLPVRVLAERRQEIGKQGRSAFALMAHGGVSDMTLGPGLRLDSYAQAGVVGARSRDLFVDGFLALTLPLGEKRKFSAGGAVWGAAQPGVSRIDAGPRASLTVPGAERVRVTADWRFRLHGKATPASGPSLTLATDF